MQRIKPLFKPKTPPQPGDWLAQHKEPGQSYRQFRALVSEPAAKKYSTLRLVPIGPLSEGQAAVFEVTKDFLKPFFGLDLVVDAPARIEDIPPTRSATCSWASPFPWMRRTLSWASLPSC